MTTTIDPGPTVAPATRPAISPTVGPAAPQAVSGRRAVVVRHELRGTLQTTTALRVGGWAGTLAADLPTARDGLDRPLLPGTSLAGALRSWLATIVGDDGAFRFSQSAIDQLFGSLKHKGHDGTVCRVRVDDAVATGPVDVAVRDGVGIDRVTGSAAHGVLYQQEVLPVGTSFGFRLVAEQTGADAERVAEAFGLLTAGLVLGRVPVGAARTRGLGGVVLTEATTTRVDLRVRAEVTAWLCGAAPSSQVDPESASLPHDGMLDVEIDWAATTPVMVRASTVSAPPEAPEAETDSQGGADGTAARTTPARPDRVVDTVPLRTADGRLLLPGSSVKGVLRSHAERIERTLRTAPDEPDSRSADPDFLAQVNDPLLEVTGALFGRAGDDTDEAGKDARRRGCLAVHDVHGDVAEERITTHVGIDRWTGGAAENLLFSVLEPTSVSWQPIRLTLDVRRLTQAGYAEPALALVLIVLRDLADGWLGLGSSTTRGRGGIAVSAVRFTATHPDPLWQAVDGRTLAEVIDDPGPEVTRAVEAWQSAVAR